MDWNKLQHTLFALDPTDPREDLAKLKAQASGASAAPAQETVDYLKESAEVREGSLQMDRDYSVADFAALAGVKVNESQKMGSAGQAKGKDPMPKAEPGRTKHPLKDKLVGEDATPDEEDEFHKDLDKLVHKTFGHSSDEKKMKKKKTDEDRIAALEARVAQLEAMLEAQKQPSLKPRDPSAQYMNDLRKSGAMGAHKDKKKAAKQGEVKHKGKQYESIKDELLAMLREK